ncbi:MAG: threonine synthase [Anaerolineales bacterium]
MQHSTSEEPRFSTFPQDMRLHCNTCGYDVVYDAPIAKCPQCGEDILEIHYDLDTLREQGWLEAIRWRKPGLWRYRELLPLKADSSIVTLGEGGTPLLHMPNLGAMLGLKHLYFKDERQGPTNSFKDRQAAVAISVMKEQGITEAVVASTRNVAIAYSAYAARAGIKLWAFLPSRVPGDKMREVAVYGTEVIKVTGTYDQTKEMAKRFADSKGIYYDRGIKSIAAMESMKTMALEIAEDLDWRAPDWYIQGVSGGMGPIGVLKGFEELHQLGVIDKIPALGLVQSAGCAPMVDAFNNGLSVAVPVENPTTIIATLATADPGRAYQILWELMSRYGGAAAKVTDEEAFEYTKMLARTAGISVEPATAVAFGGLVKMVQTGEIKPDDVVVFNCTGHTFPVEKEILGNQWARNVDLSKVVRETQSLPESGIVSALEKVARQARRVVIIEDNEAAARLLTRILQNTGGYEIHVAEDGLDGLRVVREQNPDLIITDLMMPGLDGFQVINEVKADPHLRDTPIIVLTAKDLSVQERNRLDGQIDSVLHKGSFLNEELIQRIVDALQ